MRLCYLPCEYGFFCSLCEYVYICPCEYCFDQSMRVCNCHASMIIYWSCEYGKLGHAIMRTNVYASMYEVFGLCEYELNLCHASMYCLYVMRVLFVYASMWELCSCEFRFIYIPCDFHFNYITCEYGTIMRVCEYVF